MFLQRIARVSYCMRAAPRALSVRSFSLPADAKEGEIIDHALSDFDHATGLEKKELIANQEGRPVFSDSYLGGPFGTREKPVLVPSVFDNRIVGCVGGDGDTSHELMWHEVTTEKPTMCAECGQVFALKQLTNEGAAH